MKTLKLLLLSVLLLNVSCDTDNELPTNCGCVIEISGYYMDYNVKPYTGVVTKWTGIEETNITDCNMNGVEAFNNHGRIGTYVCGENYE
jgi:hypothetical protein